MVKQSGFKPASYSKKNILATIYPETFLHTIHSSMRNHLMLKKTSEIRHLSRSMQNATVDTCDFGSGFGSWCQCHLPPSSPGVGSADELVQLSHPLRWPFSGWYFLKPNCLLFWQTPWPKPLEYKFMLQKKIELEGYNLFLVWQALWHFWKGWFRAHFYQFPNLTTTRGVLSTPPAPVSWQLPALKSQWACTGSHGVYGGRASWSMVLCSQYVYNGS